MPYARSDPRSSQSSPNLASFMADMLSTLLMNTVIYTGCRIPINWYNQSNTLLVTKIEGKQQTKEFQIDAKTKLNVELPLIIADNTKIEILPWCDEFWRHELILENTSEEIISTKMKSRPLQQWKNEISQKIGGLDHIINKITHLFNFQLDFSTHGKLQKFIKYFSNGC
jgi:hypothetical protein